jgi:septum formation protein
MGKDKSLKATLPYPLILASSSKYRAALLAQLGFNFSSVAPDVDEDQFKNSQLSALDLARKLAHEKALNVFKRYPECLVIGSDQVCSLQGHILGKPHTRERAIEQLIRMQGKTHELISAVCLRLPGREITFENKTSLTMRPLNKQSIEAYIDLDQPFDCAGSYKLEAAGIKLFSKIQMDDHTSIIGLPLIELNNHLLELGYPL